MDTNKTNTAAPAQKSQTAAPAENPALQNAEFLKKSGWTFNVIGIILFIVGLIMGVNGIWITGCAGVLSGCYLLFKSRQQVDEVKKQSQS